MWLWFCLSTAVCTIYPEVGLKIPLYQIKPYIKGDLLSAIPGCKCVEMKHLKLTKKMDTQYS